MITLDMKNMIEAPMQNSINSFHEVPPIPDVIVLMNNVKYNATTNTF